MSPLPYPLPVPHICVFYHRRRLLHCQSTSPAARADDLDRVAEDSVLGSACCFYRSWNHLSFSISLSLFLFLSLSHFFSLSFSLSLDLFPLVIDLLSLFLGRALFFMLSSFILLSSLFFLLLSYLLQSSTFSCPSTYCYCKWTQQTTLPLVTSMSGDRGRRRHLAFFFSFFCGLLATFAVCGYAPEKERTGKTLYLAWQSSPV